MRRGAGGGAVATIDPDEPLRIAKAVADIYGDATARLIQIVARRLANGIDRPGWAEAKILELGMLRDDAAEVVRQLSATAPDAIRAAITEAHAAGAHVGAMSLGMDLAPRTNTEAVRLLAEETVQKVGAANRGILRSVDDAYRAVIAETAAPGVVTGTDSRRAAAQRALDRFADRGIDGFIDRSGRRWEIETYAEMSTRTASGHAMVEGRLDAYQSDGRDVVIVSDSPGECKLCLVPGTVVSGPVVEGASRSEYVGDVVTIRTAAGNELTGTPDHSILTVNGWRRLESLHPGDEVISHLGQQWDPGVVPHDVQVPSLIEDALHPGSPLLLSGPARRDLDCHITYREVEIVSPDGGLCRPIEATFGQPPSELPLVVGTEYGLLGAGAGGLLERFLGVDLGGGNRARFVELVEHLFSVVGPSLTHDGADHFGPLFMGERRHMIDDAVMSRAGLNAGPLQVVADRPIADIEGGAELCRRLACQVAADEIVSVAGRKFRGHVWDLQTGPRWFLANGIVTHNCRPWEGELLSISGESVGDVVDGHRIRATVRQAKAAGLMHPSCRHDLRPYIPGLTKPMTHTADPAGDAARQRQRAIERQIRKWKRRESAAIGAPEAKAARAKVREWQSEMRSHLDATGGKRLRYREQVGRAR